MKSVRRQRGVTLLEQLIALAALALLGTAAMMLLGSTERARRANQPAADGVWTRATAANELAMCESAAADLAYFDLAASIAAVRPHGTPGTGVAKDVSISHAAAPAPTVPPTGFCGPVVLGNPGTWPQGFDPHDNATWSAVEWWSGAQPGVPSSWYFRCATPAPSRHLSPIYSFGDGVVVVAGERGKSVSVVGPAAVVPESQRLFDDQAGDAIVLLRTEAAMPRLSLGANLDSSSETIRLVAGDSASLDAIQQLVAGDVLIVTGRTATGVVRTAIVELEATPSAIRWPSPLDETGQPILRYFETSIQAPSATFRWGLRNSDASSNGVVIESDASVAVVDRTCGVVSFYTAQVEEGLTLMKAVSDWPLQSSRSETRKPASHALVRNAAAALRAEVRTIVVGGELTGRPVASGLTVALPIAGEKDGTVVEPLSISVKFLASALTNSSLGFTYVTMSDSVSFPVPEIDGSGLEDVELPGDTP